VEVRGSLEELDSMFVIFPANREPADAIQSALAKMEGDGSFSCGFSLFDRAGNALAAWDVTEMKEC
jgi:hypothetical protein